MRTFKEIALDVANMRWSIIEKEPQSFEAVETNIKQAIQQALSDIWTKYDMPMTYVKNAVILEANTSTLSAPVGNIKNIFINGSDSYLTYVENSDFVKQEIGTPNSYWVELSNLGNILHINPAPATPIELIMRYKTIQKAKDVAGVLKANLVEETDVLNIPPEYEEMFLNALKNLSMVYLIADSNDENYMPYREQADIHIKALLDLNGIQKDSIIRIY